MLTTVGDLCKSCYMILKNNNVKCTEIHAPPHTIAWQISACVYVYSSQSHVFFNGEMFYIFFVIFSLYFGAEMCILF